VLLPPADPFSAEVRFFLVHRSIQGKPAVFVRFAGTLCIGAIRRERPNNICEGAVVQARPVRASLFSPIFGSVVCLSRRLLACSHHHEPNVLLLIIFAPIFLPLTLHPARYRAIELLP